MNRGVLKYCLAAWLVLPALMLPFIPAHGGWSSARGWWLATTFCLVCIGVGGFVLGQRRVRAIGLPREGGWLFAGLVGFWLVAGALVFLCTFNLLNTVSAAVLAAACLPFAIHYWVRFPTASLPGRPRLVTIACVLGGLVLLAPYLVRTLLPDSDWDGAQYHLPMATDFLARGLWVPDFPLTARYRPGLVHSVYALFFAFHSESAIIPLNALALGATAAGTYRLASSFWGRRAALWSLAVLASNNIVLETALDVRVEPFLVLFFVAAVFAAMLCIRKPRAGSFLLAALFAGLLAGTKYNGLLFAGLVLGPLGVAALVRKSLTTDQKVRLLAGALALFMVPSGIFYVRNAKLFGNPVHPFMGFGKQSDEVTKQTLESKIKKGIPENRRAPQLRIDAVNEVGKKYDKKPKNSRRAWSVLVDAVLRPSDYTNKPFHWISPWLLVFFLLPLVSRNRSSLTLTGLGVGGYVLSILLFGSSGDFAIRYLSPLFPVFSIGAGICFARSSRNWVKVVFGVAVGLWLTHNTIKEYQFAAYLQPGPYVAGEEDELDYLARIGYNGFRISNEGLIKWDNTGIPRLARELQTLCDEGKMKPEDGIYMIAEAKTHKMPLRCRPSNSNTGRNFLVELRRADWDYKKLAQSLRKRGYCYLLVNRGWLKWNLEYMPVARRVLATVDYNLEAFLKQHCEGPLKIGSGIEFYGILLPE